MEKTVKKTPAKKTTEKKAAKPAEKVVKKPVAKAVTKKVEKVASKPAEKKAPKKKVEKAEEVAKKEATKVEKPVKAEEVAKVEKPIKIEKKVIKKKIKAGAPLSHGVGRRKQAVARVWVRPGVGSMKVNERDYAEYFDTEMNRLRATQPFYAVEDVKKYDVRVTVEGGGGAGQADAVCLGLARALLNINESWRSALRKAGLLTVDSRVKERKKYGQRGARRKFQFVKR